MGVALEKWCLINKQKCEWKLAQPKRRFLKALSPVIGVMAIIIASYLSVNRWMDNYGNLWKQRYDLSPFQSLFIKKTKAGLHLPTEMSGQPQIRERTFGSPMFILQTVNSRGVNQAVTQTWGSPGQRRSVMEYNPTQAQAPGIGPWHHSSPAGADYWHHNGSFVPHFGYNGVILELPLQ